MLVTGAQQSQVRIIEPTSKRLLNERTSAGLASMDIFTLQTKPRPAKAKAPVLGLQSRMAVL